jgi:hypothetical protein
MMIKRDQLGPCLREILESGNLSNLRYVSYEETINWIAFGEFEIPGLGPRLLIDWFGNGDSLLVDGYKDQGRRELAHEILLKQLLTEPCKVIGLLTESEPPQTSEMFHLLDRAYHLPPDTLARLPYESDDGSYPLDELWFDDFFFPIDWLQHKFGSKGETPQNRPGLIDESPSEQIFRPVRGRPKEHDWDWIMGEIIVLANKPDGLPDKQADLERIVADMFQTKGGQEPSVSSIRKRLGPIYQKLRSKGS